jgi:hypothetical protein
MSAEAWIGLLAIATGVMGALGAVYWKLATVATQVAQLLASSKSDEQERQRMWSVLDNHGNRLTTIETRCISQHSV